MLKAIFATVLKRYWGLVASIVMISAFSQYRHEHQVSLVMPFLIFLVVLLALLVTVVPLELHKLRKRR
jgi:Ca2+/Na+ antiporter